LAYSPSSKTLQSLYRALGGDPRTVVPKKVAQDPAASGEAVASGATNQPGTGAQ
jgi:hypothetical protein